jgi:hypothetical protein
VGQCLALFESLQNPSNPFLLWENNSEISLIFAQKPSNICIYQNFVVPLQQNSTIAINPNQTVYEKKSTSCIRPAADSS